jgi:hypothetical protein
MNARKVSGNAQRAGETRYYNTSDWLGLLAHA